MRQSIARVGLSAMLCLAPLHLARAEGGAEDEPASDRVTLVDGNEIVGTIVEVRREEAVVIVDESGRAHTLPWAQVASLTRAPTAEDGAEDADAPVDPLRVRVELTREAPVEVTQLTHFDRRLVGLSVEFMTRTVCEAPCEVVVDRDEGSVLVVKRSQTFASTVDLEGYREAVTVRVRPGRPGLMWGSLPALLLGSTAASGGIIFASLNEEVTLGSGLAMGLGIPMLAGGIAMMVLSRTRAKIVTGAR